jgi:hypothetical protein
MNDFTGLPAAVPFASFGPGGIDWAPQNKGITPVFRIKDTLHPAESEKAGRAVYFDREEYSLYIAGDQQSVATGIVDDAIRERFRDAYDKWKRGGDHTHINGTPLSRWPLATPSFIKEMEYMNIYSVDDLAAVADVHLDRIADGRAWRDRAAAWLKSANDGAAASKYAAENARMRDELSELRGMIASITGGKSVPLKARSAKRTMSDEQRAIRSERAKAMWAARKAQE